MEVYISNVVMADTINEGCLFLMRTELSQLLEEFAEIVESRTRTDHGRPSSFQLITIPEGLPATVKARIAVKGPRGSLWTTVDKLLRAYEEWRWTRLHYQLGPWINFIGFPMQSGSTVNGLSTKTSLQLCMLTDRVNHSMVVNKRLCSHEEWRWISLQLSQLIKEMDVESNAKRPKKVVKTTVEELGVSEMSHIPEEKLKGWASTPDLLSAQPSLSQAESSQTRPCYT
jgi:hypothetical protein